MKKSLIALAALAVAGAASAQVTLTGIMSMGYQSSMVGTTGLVLSDSALYLGDTEDLGGGTKAVMSLGFNAGSHTQTGPGTSTVFGEDTSLSLIGNFGSVKLMSYEHDGAFAAIESLSGASLDVGMFDSSAVGPGKRFRNGVAYSTPDMSGFVGSLSYVTLAGQYASNSNFGAQTMTIPAVTYTSGPLTIYGEYDLFNASYTGTSDDAVTQPFITATYDFGSAKVGAGWTKPSNDGASYILGVTVPVGAVTFGLATTAYAKSTTAASSAATVAMVNANGTSVWTEASVAYAMSKRTSLKASFAQTNDAGVAYANAGNGAQNYGLTQGLMQNCEDRVGLYHSF